MRRIGALIACVLISAPLVGQSTATQEQWRQWAIDQLEAGYLSTFPHYVKWPQKIYDEHPNSILVGLLGPDTLSQDQRDYLEQRGYQDRRFLVEELEGPYTAESLARVQMLYIGGLKQGENKHILSLIKDEPVLTISRETGFLADGGMIQISLTDFAVTWEVNADAAQLAGLEIDPRLAIEGQEMSQPWREDQ